MKNNNKIPSKMSSALDTKQNSDVRPMNLNLNAQQIKNTFYTLSLL